MTAGGRQAEGGPLARTRSAGSRGAGRVGLMFGRTMRRVLDREAGGGVGVVCDAFLRVAVEHAIGLRGLGYRVCLMCTHRPPDRLGEFGGNEREREIVIARAVQVGVDVVEIPVWEPEHALRDLALLWRTVREHRVGVLITHSHYDPRFLLLGLTRRNLLVIHDPQPHSGDEASAHAAGARAITRIAESSASCVMLHSALLVDQLRVGLRGHPRLIAPHGCTPADHPVLPPPQPHCLMVGRMYSYKGADIGVAAFKVVERERSDCQMTVAGEGPIATALAQRPHSRNLTVKDGYVAEESLERLIRSASLVLLPYRDATQSGVGLKAIAMGIPCVVSAAGALPDLVPEGHRAMVVAPGSVDELAEAILRHLDHGVDLREAVLGRARESAWPRVAEAIVRGLREHGLWRDDVCVT
jgi:glycosyltransferase involved in cell wall biosynthesis